MECSTHSRLPSQRHFPVDGGQRRRACASLQLPQVRRQAAAAVVLVELCRCPRPPAPTAATAAAAAPPRQPEQQQQQQPRAQPPPLPQLPQQQWQAPNPANPAYAATAQHVQWQAVPRDPSVVPSVRGVGHDDDLNPGVGAFGRVSPATAHELMSSLEHELRLERIESTLGIHALTSAAIAAAPKGP